MAWVSLQVTTLISAGFWNRIKMETIIGLSFQRLFNFFCFHNGKIMDFSFSQDWVSKQLIIYQPWSRSLNLLNSNFGYLKKKKKRIRNTWKSLQWNIWETNSNVDSKLPCHNSKIIESLLTPLTNIGCAPTMYANYKEISVLTRWRSETREASPLK